MARAVKHLWNLSQDEALREYLDAIEKKRLDRISREQWIHREGHREGLKEGHKEVALNMLRSGIDLQVILNSTKLSKQEIFKLQKKVTK